jgi:hypothetical protein
MISMGRMIRVIRIKKNGLLVAGSYHWHSRCAPWGGIKSPIQRFSLL